ncbi:MAG: hypothetical protein UX63_C0027G0001, partial [Microgenomates group bacterium GW2011_GWB1_46_7]
MNVNGNTTSTNFFNVSNAQLTTGSLITGTAANDTSGFKLLDLLSGASPTSKFSVADDGDVITAGTITLPNTNTLTGITNYLQASQGISVGGGTTYYINSSGTANLNAATVNGTLTLNSVASVTDNNQVLTLDSGVTKYIDTTAWDKNGSDDLAATSIPWLEGSGVLYPKNSTVDLLVGGQATSSAKFKVLNMASGTPVASMSASYWTSDGTLSTTARQSLTIGNSSTYNTTGNILINPNSTGNVGIGLTNPTAQLHVYETGSNSESPIWDATADTKIGYSDSSNKLIYGILSTATETFTIGGPSQPAAYGIKSTGTTNTGISYGGYFSATTSEATGTGYGIYSEVSGTGTEYSGIFAGGNVGIGTSTPEDLLEIQGAEATSAILTLDADDGDDVTDTWEIQSVAADNDLSLVNGSTEVFNLTSAGALQIDGDLTISGDDLYMGTNTAGMLLIADGTNFNPTAMSGDITI